MKILLVEDDKWFAESLINSFSNIRPDFKLKHSLSAAEAIIAIDEFQPDLILLDLVLSNINGLTLLQEMQSYDDTKKIPIIILTSMAAELDMATLSKLGVRKILDKASVSPQEIITACLNEGGKNV